MPRSPRPRSRSAVARLAVIALAGACGTSDAPGVDKAPAAQAAATGAATNARPAAKAPKDAQPAPPAVAPPPPESRRDPWRTISDEALYADITAALDEAKVQQKKVLLDFVADWCDDCREVLRVAELPPARDVLAESYIVVPVNVGRWERAEHLRDRYKVKAIATLVVLDANGRRVAQTTLEPITKKAKLTPALLAAWLSSPKDAAPSPKDRAPNATPTPKRAP